LINIENYQGIDVSETKTPVVLTRLDTQIIVCNKTRKYFLSRETLYGDPNVQDNCEINNYFDEHFQLPKEFKLSVGRWSCYAKFELLLPEIQEAPHILEFKRSYGNQEFFMPYNNVYGDAEPGESYCQIKHPCIVIYQLFTLKY